MFNIIIFIIKYKILLLIIHNYNVNLQKYKNIKILYYYLRNLLNNIELLFLIIIGNHKLNLYYINTVNKS